jgi:hypothetical protein
LPAFLLACVVAALTTLAGRGAVRVARLSTALGRSGPLLVACWLGCAAACGLAAQLGAAVAAQLAAESRGLLAATALVLAAAELLVLRPSPTPVEPTRSFGAIALVLGVAQLTAAAGLVVFALAGATGSPWLAAAGAALGSGTVLTAAWSSGREWETRIPLGPLRRAAAALLLAAALVTGLPVIGLA